MFLVYLIVRIVYYKPAGLSFSCLLSFSQQHDAACYHRDQNHYQPEYGIRVVAGLRHILDDGQRNGHALHPGKRPVCHDAAISCSILAELRVLQRQNTIRFTRKILPRLVCARFNLPLICIRLCSTVHRQGEDCVFSLLHRRTDRLFRDSERIPVFRGIKDQTVVEIGWLLYAPSFDDELHFVRIEIFQ